MKQHTLLRGLALLLCLSLVLGLVPGGILGGLLKVNAAEIKSSEPIFSDNFNASYTPTGSKETVKVPNGWISSIPQSAAISCAGYEKFDGSAALFIQAAGYVSGPLFGVVAGEEYTITYLAKKYLDTVGTGGYVAIKFTNAAGTVISMESFAIGEPRQWQTVEKVATAPSGATMAFIEVGAANVTGDPIFGLENLAVYGVAGEQTEPEQPSDGDNLIPNGDFEASATQIIGWNRTAGNANFLSVDAGAGRNNSVALFLNDHSPNASIEVQSDMFNVEAGASYDVSVWTKLAGENAKGISGYIIWLNDDGTLYDPLNKGNYNNEFYQGLKLTFEADWKKNTTTVTVPDDVNKAAIRFYVDVAGVLSAYFDDITIAKSVGGPELPTEPGDVDPNWSFENLNENGMPINWDYTENRVTIQTPDNAPHGTNVIQVEDPGDTVAPMASSAKISVEPGKSYRLKVMARVLSGGPGRIGLFVRDASGTYVDAACMAVEISGEAWKMYQVQTTIPANGATLQVEIYTTVAGSVTFQADAIVVEEVEGGGDIPWIPGEYDPPVIENFPGKHPYVFFTTEELEAIKAVKNDATPSIYGFSWKSQVDNIIRSAENYLNETKIVQGFNFGTYVTFEIYPELKDPNDLDYYRPLYEAASKDKDGNLVENPYLGFGCLIPDSLRPRLETLALAYALTGDTRYSDRAIFYAESMSNWKWWGDQYWLTTYTGGSAKADASVAWAMQGVVAVYDLCYDAMTDAQKETIETAIIEKGLYYLAQDFNPNSTQNGNMMLLGGMLSGIATIINEDNYEEIKPYVDQALSGVHVAFGNYYESGNTEGHYYTSFGLEYFLPGVAHLYRATGLEDLGNHPLMTEMLPYWTVQFAAPGTNSHPNYGDGSSNVYLKLPMGTISKMTGDPLANYFLVQTGGIGNAFENLMYLDPNPEIKAPTDLVAVVDPIGFGSLRTGFAKDDMLLTMLSNNSQMGHNHMDQNSIQFNVAGSWLIQDPGAGSYYYSDRTFWTANGHSTILVDGNGQNVRGTGKMEKVFGNELYGYIIGSAPKAYGADYDSDILEKFDRHAIQINHEKGAYYVLIDDLLSKKEHTYSWQMYNGERVGVEVDGEILPENVLVKGNDVSMVVGVNKLNLSFVSGEKLNMGDMMHTANGAKVGYTFIANSAATKAHQFMTVISTEEVYGRDYLNFGALVSGEYTDTNLTLENGVSFKTSHTGGRTNLKPNQIGTIATIFMRGGGVGDYLKIPFQIKEDGTYDLSVIMGISDGCCTTVVKVDDIAVSEPYDLSGYPESSRSFEFTGLKLKAGKHYITCEIVDKGYSESYAGNGWYLINAGGLIINRTDVVEETVAEKVTVKETYDDENALGALINYTGNLCDLVMFNRTDALVAAGKLSTDGQQASVLGLKDGKITEGFAATNATKLIYDGKTLFEAAKALNIVADADGWHIDTAEAQTVKLNIGTAEKLAAVTVNGQKVDATAENGIITLTLAAGASDVAVEFEKHVHTPGEAVVEKNVAPDCDTDGSYDNVVYCTVCEEELSRETVTVPKLGHTRGEAVVEKNVAPDCDTDGSYDNVVYCTVCEEELSRETVTVPKLGHTPGEAVVEKNVAPDCDADGSYDNVVYCTVCEEELSRETVTVPKLGHTPGEAVVEKNVAPDCDTDGSYDNVVYCTVCEEELSRETKTVAALGHDLVHHEAKAPTETEIGWEAYDTCTRCDYTTYVEIPALVAAGDFNGDDELTDADAIYLLYATFDPDGYPLNQKADLNGDGEVTDADAIYLLYATFDPDGYPLN